MPPDHERPSLTRDERSDGDLRAIGSLATATVPGRSARVPAPACQDHLHAGQQTALLCRLVQLRKEAGINQTVLAGRLGITQSEVSKFERGERRLDEIRLRSWLRALRITLTPFVDAIDEHRQRLDDYVDGGPPMAHRDGAPALPQTGANDFTATTASAWSPASGLGHALLK